MDRRAIRRAVALTVWVAACGSHERLPSGDGTAPGLSSDARAVIRAERAAAVRVTWVLRAEDCFTCLTPAAELRRLARAEGGSVSVRVVVVGDGAAGVQALMRRQRIESQLTSMTPRSYRRAFGRLPLPGVFVARGDSVVAAWFGEEAARAELSSVSLGALGAAASGAPATLPGTRMP